MKTRGVIAPVVLSLVLAGLVVSSATAQESPRNEPAGGPDREQLALADRHPGFGGMYRDPAGRLIVVLRDRSALGALEAELGPVIAQRGEHDFRDLHRWRSDARRRVLAHDAVVTLDVDETRNRVTVGVDRAAGEAGLRAARRLALRAGVPADALVVEAVEAIHRVATLQDSFRPVPGGVQIRFSNFLCTLGFNAGVDGVAGFVTNSHCTDQQGGVHKRRPTEYYQPLNQTPAEHIGTEEIDPSYFKRANGCPRGASCRFSDSAWASYDDPSLSGGAAIARTTGPGSLTIDPANPNFSITGTLNGATVGTTVNKMGRTTGWTVGPVSGSCVDVGVSGSNLVLLCQDLVDAGVGSGDSGSPVFIASGGSATLVGVLWGGSSDGSLFVYSPYGAVRSELGLD